MKNALVLILKGLARFCCQTQDKYMIAWFLSKGNNSNFTLNQFFHQKNTIKCS